MSKFVHGDYKMPIFYYARANGQQQSRGTSSTLRCGVWNCTFSDLYGRIQSLRATINIPLQHRGWTVYAMDIEGKHVYQIYTFDHRYISDESSDLPVYMPSPQMALSDTDDEANQVTVSTTPPPAPIKKRLFRALFPPDSDDDEYVPKRAKTG